MIIKTFGFQKKFSVNTTFLDETLIMEGELEEGETWEDAITEARKRMIAKVESYAPGSASWTPGTEFPDHMKTKVEFGHPPVIDKSFERLEIAIDNCISIEELDQLKRDNPLFPASLLENFNKKRKELTNAT